MTMVPDYDESLGRDGLEGVDWNKRVTCVILAPRKIFFKFFYLDY